MQRLRPPSLNTLSFWLWAMALLFFAVFAATATRRMQSDLERKEHGRIVAGTLQAMELWERQVLDATASWLASLEQAGDLRRLELRAREESPWVDSFYLWDTQTGQVIHPTAVTRSFEGETRGCIAQAERLAPFLPARAEAASYLSCLPSAPAADILLTGRAARLLLQAGRPDAALRALRAGQAPLALDLQAGLTRGIASEDLADWRLLHIEILLALGEQAQVRSAGLQLGREIANLSGPALSVVLERTVPALTERLQGRSSALELAELTASLERAERRADAWYEVHDRLSRRTDLSASPHLPQLLRDPYGSPPYLLLFRRLGGGRMAGAVQVDEGVLVERLLEVILEGHGSQVQVQDGSGRHIAGPSWTSPQQRQLTFPLVFEYLRIRLPPTRHQVPPAERNRLLLIQLLPIGLTVLLGALALLARAAAVNRQLEFESRRSEFVTRVTHELKTPLAGIRVMAEALELGAYRNEAEHAELAQRILKESERLASRVDEVLDMARDPKDFTREPCNLGELCNEVAGRWRDLMVQNDIELVVNVQALPVVSVHRNMLRDALGALLENAIKYRDPTRASRVRFEARASGRRWVVFEVVDNGLGVPSAKRKVIFEPFARVEGPGRGRAGGHGLGLSFVANAARVHHGRAECREGIEGGCRFILRIRRQG